MVSGGLGVACFGLVKALNATGTDVLFVLPKPLAHNGHDHHAAGASHRPTPDPRHVPMVTDRDVHAAVEKCATPSTAPRPFRAHHPAAHSTSQLPQDTPEKLHRVTFVPVDSPLTPYLTPRQYQRMVVEEFIRDNAGGRWVQCAFSSGP